MSSSPLEQPRQFVRVKVQLRQEPGLKWDGGDSLELGVDLNSSKHKKNTKDSGFNLLSERTYITHTADQESLGDEA